MIIIDKEIGVKDEELAISFRTIRIIWLYLANN